MTGQSRLSIAPIYLLACLILGGSGQGVLGPLLLQLSGLALIGWSWWFAPPHPPSVPARQLGWIVVAAAVLAAAQLVPLPPALWTALPGREMVIANLRLLGEPLPWLPLSLTPYEGYAAALSLIPPAALVFLIVRAGAYRADWLALAITFGALLNILLGAFQVSTGGFYLFAYSTLGSAAGFFANGNYLGTLLMTAIPFLAALAAVGHRRSTSSRGRAGLLGAAAGMLLLLVIGLLISKSMAALLLTLPVALASSLLLRPQQRSRWRLAGLLAAGCAVAAVLAYARLPAAADPNNALSTSIRLHLYGKTAQLAAASFPVGTGLGSFPRVYAMGEDPGTFFGAAVNHAHNDYLEFLLEGGLPGLLILIAGVGWWLRRLLAIWRSPASTLFERAATIASAAVLLHSLVDFPARTLAIAGVLATSFALMAEPRERRRAEDGAERRPARHVSLD